MVRILMALPHEFVSILMGWCYFSVMFTGLIAAACGRLETVLHDNAHVSKPLTSAMSNGHSMVKIHQNGGAIKSSNGSVNGVYSNGNGVH